MTSNPLAGKVAPPGILIDIAALVSAYYTGMPDPSIPQQRVSFGTSGHRGSSFDLAFNERHILAITQAICLHRQMMKITGPLFIGIDTHALSVPAYATALEVLAANGVEVFIAKEGEYTPTPVISHAILTYNRKRSSGLADGIIITPSHNPPRDGGFKYNPSNGGPADQNTTKWIEDRANDLLGHDLNGVNRLAHRIALNAATTHSHDFLTAYVEDLGNTVDMSAIRNSKVHLGVDPLGGAGVHYWARIAERYGLNLTVIDDTVDSTFRFMTVDWDGQIRMDPSSPFAMQRLIAMKDRFDLSFSCDTDHDRHGIVSKVNGLMPPNHDLCTSISYLFKNRPLWSTSTAVGKTIVSSQMIDRITAKMGRALFEVPVGFKWYVDGLLKGSLGFAGEESAGSVFLRINGDVWTTDKDGIIPCLLAAEISARTGNDPARLYNDITNVFGDPIFDRIDFPATPEQKAVLAGLSPKDVTINELAGDRITEKINRAPGNGAPIGGVKVSTKNGWFAARPSGTENVYKIYAESFQGAGHLQRILADAQKMINDLLSVADIHSNAKRASSQ
jgi:phosphoglucomutase